MSSSFTNQPPPYDPRSNEGYTPTPPAREPGREEDPIEGVRPQSKLGSLAQKARGKKLRQARIVLFLAGVLLLASALFDILTFHSQFQAAVDKEIKKQGGPGVVQINQGVLKQAEDNAFAIACAIDGAFFFVGIVFFVLGAIVYRYPVPVTILGLVLFILALGAGFVIVSISGDAENIARYVASGWLLRLVIIVGLASSIQSAIAYEKERRAAEDYAYDG